MYDSTAAGMINVNRYDSYIMISAYKLVNIQDMLMLTVSDQLTKTASFVLKVILVSP
jgi:hypothetical protein